MLPSVIWDIIRIRILNELRTNFKLCMVVFEVNNNEVFF